MFRAIDFRAIDQRVERLNRRVNLALPDGMLDFLDSKPFAAATVAAITAVLCYVSGFGGDVGLFVIPALVALTYWLTFR
jgi:hypothetical protein